MRINPLTYGVAALREGLYASHPGAIASLPAFGLSFAVAAVFALAMYAMAARVANRAVVT
jgi:hypothetical protein